MATIRRWYILLVCAVSLHATTWATIALLRGVLQTDGRDPVAAVAFQLAVIIIGLPIFLGHWIWGQRLASGDPEERGSPERRFYLYATMAALLWPAIFNGVSLVQALLRLISSGSGSEFIGRFTPIEQLLRSVVALVVLGLLWWYHHRIVNADRAALPETDLTAGFRRFYLFAFSTTGLIMVASAATSLLRWLLFQFGSGPGLAGSLPLLSLYDDIARLAIGVPVWLIFWSWAQALFAGPDEDEHESALRKLYLYAIVFVTVLAAVTNATFILAGLLQQLLGLSPEGDLRDPLTIIIASGVFWAYHARVLQQDATRSSEVPRQAAVRRTYLYLVAAIGLAAALVGGGGILSVIIRAFAERGFTDLLSTQLAWFTASLIAGLAVWIWPWRRIMAAADLSGPAGSAERTSLVRKIYLYGYLFVATMVVLSGAIYVIARLLRLILGDPIEGNLLSDLGQALAFTILAGLAWLYHGSEVRADGRAQRRELATRLAALRVAIVAPGDGSFGQAVATRLQQELPGLQLDLIRPDGEASVAAAQLAEAGLIVGPWTMATSGPEGLSPELVQLVHTSPARKLLVPTRSNAWQWIGVESSSTETLIAQTVRTVRQIGEGEEARPARSLNLGNILGFAVLGLVVLFVLLSIVLGFVGNLLF